MSFVKKLAKAVDPLSRDTYKHSLNPMKAHIKGYKEGGVEGFIDPFELLGNNRPDTPEEAQAYVDKARNKAKNRKATGMKRGGKTSRACCRGMGAAIKGGGYGK